MNIRHNKMSHANPGFGFACDALETETGWQAYYQLPNRPARIYIEHEKTRTIFGSRDEAYSAALAAFLPALNRLFIAGTIRVSDYRNPKVFEAAEKLFKGVEA